MQLANRRPFNVGNLTPGQLFPNIEGARGNDIHLLYATLKGRVVTSLRFGFYYLRLQNYDEACRVARDK